MKLLNFSDSSGIWGAVTSNMDWCEENYHVTPLVAEFWNTLTNLSMIIPSMFGFLFCLRNKLEMRSSCTYLFLFAVGLGSWLFHMTLKYEMQLFDEMPMIWGTSVLVYCLWEIDGPPKQTNVKTAVVLLTYCLISTYIYVATNQPFLFHLVYGALVFAVTVCGLRVIWYFPHSTYLGIAALAVYTTGFVFWNIDNMFCHHLLQIRRHLFMPVHAFTQLHAWWHIFAGCGTYFCIAFCTHARSIQLKRPMKIKLFCGFFPYLSTT